MPNNTVSDWSVTPASNTEVGGVDLAENSMRPRDVNNAIRTMMSQIATGILAWPTTTIELGHATDTTLSRGAAGFMAVEGKRVPAPASQAAGDILYRGATEWERLAKGTAYQILRQNSALTAPEWATAREVLTANRTYYVRTDGSDSNDGLANTSGGGWLTIQHAMDVVATLDFGGFTVTVQIADGTYAGATILPVTVGQATTAGLIIQGNNGTPGNVVISTTSASCFTAGANARARILDLEMRTTTSGYCINADSGAVEYGNVRFGACAQSHIRSTAGASVTGVSNYSIVGNAQAHVLANRSGVWWGVFLTVTLTGTPAFSVGFIDAREAGSASAGVMTFSGSATGARYSATLNGVINTLGGGASYLPGNAVGSTATGGQYA